MDYCIENDLPRQRELADIERESIEFLKKRIRKLEYELSVREQHITKLCEIIDRLRETNCGY